MCQELECTPGTGTVGVNGTLNSDSARRGVKCCLVEGWREARAVLVHVAKKAKCWIAMHVIVMYRVL